MAGMLLVRCGCGTVQGEADAHGGYARVTCYCRDCRAYAQWLDRPGLLDPAGGTDIVAMAPSRLRYTAGVAEIACATISGRVHRWYAACCRTPLGNTPRNQRIHYVGVPVACLAPAGFVDDAFGPAGRCVVNAESAVSPVAPTRLALAGAGLRIAAGVFGARLRGTRASPFYSERSGEPISAPHPIS